MREDGVVGIVIVAGAVGVDVAGSALTQLTLPDRGLRKSDANRQVLKRYGDRCRGAKDGGLNDRKGRWRALQPTTVVGSGDSGRTLRASHHRHRSNNGCRSGTGSRSRWRPRYRTWYRTRLCPRPRSRGRHILRRLLRRLLVEPTPPSLGMPLLLSQTITSGDRCTHAPRGQLFRPSLGGTPF
jgi:hypothetical protein